jgi:glucose-6-phosphate dehydrogenase assembly protein OpcA
MAGALDGTSHSPRGETIWRESAPDTLEADLAGLWRDAGRKGAVSGALMSNLVVVSPRGSFPDAEALARKHPARVILLSYTAGVENASPPESVRVGLLTFGDAEAGCGLEFIRVHTACADRSIPSIVGRLAIGGVPTTVWWTDDLSRMAPPPAIATLGRQLIYNSALWQDVQAGVAAAVTLLCGPQGPDLADLNWRRIAPIRDGLVQALRLDPGNHNRASQARIAHVGSETPAAWHVAGWLMARLEKTGEPGISQAPVVAPLVQAAADGDFLSVTLGGTAWSVSASMNQHRVEVKSGRPTYSLPVPQESEADAVAGEMRNLAPDTCLRETLNALARTPPARAR